MNPTYQDKSKFEEPRQVRLTPEQLQEVKKLVKKYENKDTGFVFESESHFFRVAVIRLIRDVKNKVL